MKMQDFFFVNFSILNNAKIFRQHFLYNTDCSYLKIYKYVFCIYYNDTRLCKRGRNVLEYEIHGRL